MGRDPFGFLRYLELICIYTEETQTSVTSGGVYHITLMNELRSIWKGNRTERDDFTVTVKRFSDHVHIYYFESFRYLIKSPYLLPLILKKTAILIQTNNLFRSLKVY